MPIPFILYPCNCFFLSLMSVCFLSPGDWSETDRQPLWVDISKGRHSEGCWHSDCERWHWSHCGVSRSWSRLHLLHW